MAFIGLEPWPDKLSREEARAIKLRRKEFVQALKDQARPRGWRFARADIFREQAGWFISNLPSLGWRSGVQNRLQIKPMALDPLFWDIVGLPDNHKLPLSFRATGAWVLQPPSRPVDLSPQEDSPMALANQVVDWTTDCLASLSSRSLDSMLAELGPEDNLTHQRRALAICLHLLNEDLDRAKHLCLSAGDQHSLLADSGGFVTHHPDGTFSTFNQQALRWIETRRG